MLIEIHMLKNYAPTNLNRDDTGAPKTCVFGGVQRGRISSQCLKRSWRKSSVLVEEIGAENIGIRTRKLPQIISSRLMNDGVSKELAEAMEKKLSGIGTKKGEENKKDPRRTAQIIIYSPEDIDAVVDEAKKQLHNCKSAKEVEKLSAKDIQAVLQKSVNRAVTLDIALFGRMVTSEAFADVEASVQVAHAISTNKVLMEADYYTAVDDLIDGLQDDSDDSGSGMIGDIDYNSSCYYIYASIDTDKLRENLKYSENKEELVHKAVPALLKAMTFSNPSGKQNSFAGHSLPSAILVECKEKHVSVSYANAFEKPVTVTKEGGYIYNSIRKLKDEVQNVHDLYGVPVVKRLWFTSENLPIEDQYGTNCRTFDEILSNLAEV